MRVMVLIKATEQSEAGEMPSQELLEQTGLNDSEPIDGSSRRSSALRSPRVVAFAPAGWMRRTVLQSRSVS